MSFNSKMYHKIQGLVIQIKDHTKNRESLINENQSTEVQKCLVLVHQTLDKVDSNIDRIWDILQNSNLFDRDAGNMVLLEIFLSLVTLNSSVQELYLRPHLYTHPYVSKIIYSIACNFRDIDECLTAAV